MISEQRLALTRTEHLAPYCWIRGPRTMPQIRLRWHYGSLSATSTHIRVLYWGLTTGRYQSLLDPSGEYGPRLHQPWKMVILHDSRKLAVMPTATRGHSSYAVELSTDRPNLEFMNQDRDRLESARY